MTAVVAPPTAAHRPRVAAGAAVAGVGCALLSLRPGGDLARIALFTGLGLVGICWPLPSAVERPAGAADPAVRRRAARRTLAVTVVGVVAFAAGRVIGRGNGLITLTSSAVVLNTLAAVAEEAFFRRLVLGLLAGRGAVVAVAGSALCFALVHIHTYGGWVVPIDLAAGALLGWQRWVSGGWAAPGVTHVVANLLALA